MTRLWDEFELPGRFGEGVRLRAPREGTYWQLKDGLIVRVAAGESVPDAESEQRALLALAVRDAVEQQGKTPGSVTTPAAVTAIPSAVRGAPNRHCGIAAAPVLQRARSVVAASQAGQPAGAVAKCWPACPAL